MNNTTIELEGNSQTVHMLFTEIREYGIGVLAKLQEKTSVSTTSSSNVETINSEGYLEDNNTEINFEWPSLKHILLTFSPKQESEWILIYAVYSSDKGNKLFTIDEIRQLYKETNRYSISNQKNLMKNIKRLLKDKYISVMDEKDYRIEKLGLEFAEKIITNDRVQNGKSKKTPTKKTIPSYNLINLNLSNSDKENLKNFWNSKSHKKNIDKAVLIAYWLKENKNISEITPDHLFSILKFLSESVAFDLSGALRNAKHFNHYFSSGTDPKTYTITHLGEEQVQLLKEE